eukprot:TRINITY_DN11296_c0_g1_i1.p1 TRINITY_DN11296_c0_g1~~TRINITY_DN11296_c0_g1_i1.p1  ORF type:complete len:103 (-),score=7.99 TRINITY_DN11296_c0_g1_i1:96-404(-)
MTTETVADRVHQLGYISYDDAVLAAKNYESETTFGCYYNPSDLQQVSVQRPGVEKPKPSTLFFGTLFCIFSLIPFCVALEEEPEKKDVIANNSRHPPTIKRE